MSLSSRKNVLTWNTVLLAFVFVLFFLNCYHRTMFLRPNSIHQWRQSDCLSITKNYYEEGMDFFHPRIHYQGVSNGNAVSEFPILNYVGAGLWKVFGEHEFIYRLMEYTLFIGAVFMLFNTLLKRWNSGWLALFAAGVLLSSPLLTYYNLNFLSDVPALSVAIMAYCCLYNFINGANVSRYYLALILGTLAALMKASALIPLVLVIIVGASGLIRNTKYRLAPFVFRNKPALIASVIVSCGLILSWYQYALYYNAYYSNKVFLLTVLPIWEITNDEIIHNGKILFNEYFPLFLNRPMLFLLFVLVFYVISRFRSLERFLQLSFLVSGLFFVFYIPFFYQVFWGHDYYLVNLFIFPVVTFFCVIQLLTQGGTLIVNPRFMRIFIVVTLFFNSVHAAAMYRLRTVPHDSLNQWYPFTSEDELKMSEYLFWAYSLDIQKLEHFTSVLRKHGIKREDRVLSIPDRSFDISLYMMDQKGFTNDRNEVLDIPDLVDRFSKKVDYVVLSDTTLKQVQSFKNAKRLELFFTEGPVQVFKVRNHD
jgi:hypothetical protein